MLIFTILKQWTRARAVRQSIGQRRKMAHLSCLPHISRIICNWMRAPRHAKTRSHFFFRRSISFENAFRFLRISVRSTRLCGNRRCARIEVMQWFRTNHCECRHHRRRPRYIKNPLQSINSFRQPKIDGCIPPPLPLPRSPFNFIKTYLLLPSPWSHSVPSNFLFCSFYKETFLFSLSCMLHRNGNPFVSFAFAFFIFMHLHRRSTTL